MWVRLPLPVPARRKRHITCDELFHFIVKLIVRSFCRSSLPNRTRSAGIRLGAALWAAVFALVKISVLTVLSTWWQSSLCDHVFLCLRQKRRHPPAPLLFLFKSNPLRRASIWSPLRANTVPFPPCGENCTMLAPSSFPNRTRFAGLRFGSRFFDNSTKFQKWRCQTWHG